MHTKFSLASTAGKMSLYCPHPLGPRRFWGKLRIFRARILLPRIILWPKNFQGTCKHCHEMARITAQIRRFPRIPSACVVSTTASRPAPRHGFTPPFTLPTCADCAYRLRILRQFHLSCAVTTADEPERSQRRTGRSSVKPRGGRIGDIDYQRHLVTVRDVLSCRRSHRCVGLRCPR